MQKRQMREIWLTNGRIERFDFYLKVVGAGAAIAAAIFAFLQFGSMQEQTALTRTMSINSQSAYVSVLPGNVFNVGSSKRWEPRLIFRNTGQTPARNVRRHFELLVSTPLTPEQEAKLGVGSLEPGSPILSANGADDVVFRTGDQITDAMRELIQKDVNRLYVFGRVDYENVFGESRWIEFCHYYSGEMTNWLKNGGWGYNSTQTRHCTAHNDAYSPKLSSE